MKNKYLLTIMADNRPGLLSQIAGMLNRKQLDIEGISAAKTDANSIVSITIELTIADIAIRSLQLRIENIVEVFKTDIIKLDNAVCQRVVYYKLSKDIFNTVQCAAIQHHGVQIVNWYPDALVISKSGSDSEIRNLYNRLEGMHLLGFMQSGIIAETQIMEDDEYRVMKIAA